jgi:hypothetical protein
MAALTKRERVLRTARFQETDRVPLYDILENEAIIEHYAQQTLTVENGMSVKGLAIGRALDMTRMPGGPQPVGERLLENGIRLHQERWTSWIVERPFDDRASLVSWIEADIQRTEERVYNRAYAQQIHDHVSACQATFAQSDPTGRDDSTVLVLESGVGLTEMYWWVGLEHFAYLLADEPGLVEAWLDARSRAELRRVAAIADPRLVPIVLTYDDLAYKTGLLFSPAWLRRFWIPRLRDLNAAWHDRDTLCLFHSDGNLWGILDDLVAAGIDGLNPLETNAGMSIAEVRVRYPHLFLAGGIDVSQLLCLGTPDEVRRVCHQAIADSGERGYFLGSTTELHWEARLENAIAMFETAWETDRQNQPRK